MTQWSVIVPVLHFFDARGGLDHARTRQYAEVATSTWIDRFLVSGSTAGGADLGTSDRAALLDLWAEAAGPDRLLACAWDGDDIAAARDRGILPMAVMTAGFVGPDPLQWLAHLPPATVYSHPVHGPTWTPELAHAARAAGSLPVGGKVSKVSVSDVADLVSAAPEFRLWDGSARHIQESLTAGADGVVLTPLAADLDVLPTKSVELVQSTVTTVQTELDRRLTAREKREFLLERAVGRFMY